MRNRILLIAAGVVALVLIASQVILPSVAGSRIEDRLTANGGTASVSVSAVPALRLLFGDGGSLTATGTGLDLQPESGDQPVFDKLDGFDHVQLTLASFRAGPFDVSRFQLTRDGSEPYTLNADATTSGADLADFGAAQLGLPNGSLVRFLAGELPGAGGAVPISLNMQLESDGGRIKVVSGGGTIAGFPTGPLAELITSAITIRL